VGAIDRGTVGLVDASRIGSDAVAEWKPAPLADGLPKNPMNLFECIRSIAFSALANGILYTCDPDCTNTLPPIVVVDTFVDLKGKRKINWDETITFHSFVGLLGGLTLTSEPFNTPPYNEKTSLRMMEILNPPAPDKGWALYGGTDPMNHHFGFLAKRNWGNFASLILFNPEDKSSDVALNTALLKEIGECFHVWSFWEEKYLGIGDATFVAKNLPPHGSKVLRLTQLPERDDFPVLVGSNLHISMGSSEIRILSSNPNGMTIELTDAGAREGKLFIYSKKPLILEKSTGCNSFIVPEKNNIYIIVLTDRQRGIGQVISVKTSDMTQKGSVEVLKDAKLLARFYSAGFDFLK
jgi:hypothetical protein